MRGRLHLAWVVVSLLAAGGAVGGALGAQPGEPPPLHSGTQKILMPQRVLGIRRSYYVHVPAVDRTTPLPIVVALHGAFSTGREFERLSGFSALADREGFIVVYPQGIGLGNLFRHWNSGHCCGRARKMNLDDVGFVLASVEDAARRTPVDRSRLYVTGFSNGGMLAYRIAAEHPDIVAAVAVVSGTIGGRPAANEPEWSLPRPRQPVAVLAMHGRADANVPYDGGRGAQSHGTTTAISVARSIGLWVDVDGCNADPQLKWLAQGRIERRVWSGCRRDTQVVLYSLKDWGHQWPDAKSLDGFDAAGQIWQFFAQHGTAP